MKSNYTRTLSPKLGILGILGIFGFLGFLPDLLHARAFFPIPVFFFFFGFFGFFGFYYEGKMSNTLIDERFQTNAYRAEAVANKIALCLIVGVAMVSTMLLKQADPYTMLSLFIGTIGFAFGLSIFLQQYLLYRYETEV